MLKRDARRNALGKLHAAAGELLMRAELHTAEKAMTDRRFNVTQVLQAAVVYVRALDRLRRS